MKSSIYTLFSVAIFAASVSANSESNLGNDMNSENEINRFGRGYHGRSLYNRGYGYRRPVVVAAPVVGEPVVEAANIDQNENLSENETNSEGIENDMNSENETNSEDIENDMNSENEANSEDIENDMNSENEINRFGRGYHGRSLYNRGYGYRRPVVVAAPVVGEPVVEAANIDQNENLSENE
ncbi:hypothetical protein AYI70_g9383, partial [Smittium culicis]